jgi:hypothetical protein
METVRTHVILPLDIVEAIDKMVGQRGRSAFLADVARQEVKRRKLLAILDHPGPIWKSSDHPELKDGSAAWVSRMRKEDEAIRSKRVNETPLRKTAKSPQTAR